MKLKAGVKLADLTPQMVLAAIVVRDAFQQNNCTITSANDSTHSALSLHYKGNALDFRTKDYGGNKEALVSRIKECLGPDFDVILESLGQEQEHLHIEYDAK